MSAGTQGGDAASRARSPRTLLVVNGGSSSLRCALFRCAGGAGAQASARASWSAAAGPTAGAAATGTLAGAAGTDPQRVLSAHVERVGHAEATLSGVLHDGAVVPRRRCDAPDAVAALDACLAWMGAPTADRHGGAGAERGASSLTAAARTGTGWPGAGDLEAVGHRFVHGGAHGLATQRVDAALRAALDAAASLAPDHVPAQLALLDACTRRFPQAVQVACFDTAFHRDLPRVAQLLPLPRRLLRPEVRRYGFHGLSCAFLMTELARRGGAGEAAGCVILAHLGHGASLTAVRDGASVETTMGFTPAGGIPMSTRPGDLDPGLLAWLAAEHGLHAGDLHALVHRESGLLGVSGSSGDMRALLEREAHDPGAADAVALFCHGVRKAIGALAAVLGGLDALVFAGGIGENAPAVRARCTAGLQHLGIRLAAERNAAGAPLLSEQGAAVRVHLIRTEEALQVAREALAILGP